MERCLSADCPIWWRNWSRTIPFFDYPPAIRRIIYTTNAIESVNRSLRKITKNRGSFPSDEALLKLFYLALMNISRKWTMPLRDWKAALNRFTIQFEDRMQNSVEKYPGNRGKQRRKLSTPVCVMIRYFAGETWGGYLWILLPKSEGVILLAMKVSAQSRAH